MRVSVKSQRGERIELNIVAGTSVLDLLNGIDLSPETPCGGKGTCGKCLVRCLPLGAFSEPDAQEKARIPSQLLEKGIRLACRTNIVESCSIEVLPARDFENIMGAADHKFAPGRPYVSKRRLKIPTDLGDSERIEYLYGQLGKDNLEDLSIEPSTISDEITVVSRPGKIVRLSPTEDPEKNFGVAIDIGTTTIAIALIDMTKGIWVDTSTILNPQRKFGHDVISRICYSNASANGFERLRVTLVEVINASVKEIAQRHGLVTEDIEQFVIAGNTTMSHFFFGFPVEQIAVAPYRPFTCSEIVVPAKVFGRIYGNQAEMYGFPALSAFVGGDIVAGVLFTETLGNESTLFIDLGTNGEIVYADGEEIHCCSTAAGPAFEGANISCGTGYIHGAIESVDIAAGKIEIHTVAGKKATGICGTGLISIVAEFLRNGIIQSTGRFNKGMNPLFLDKYEESEKRFWLSDTIFVSQSDIRNFQLAKSAIRTGIETIMKDRLLNQSEIKIAGGFSNGLRTEDLYTTGMLPPMNSKVEFVGNTSLLGCIKYLLDRRSSEDVRRILEKADYIELSNQEMFREMFVDNLGF